MRGAEGVFDGLALGLGQAAEAPDVEIDPAHRIILRLAGDENDFAGNDAGIAHHEAAGLDHHLRQVVAEMLGHRTHDGHAEIVDRRHFGAVAHRIAAAEIDHAQLHPGLLQVGEQHGDAGNRAFIRRRAGLLAADMERDAIGVEAKAARLHHQVARHLQLAAELARQRPFRTLVLDQDAAIDARARRVLRDLQQFRLAVEGEHGHTGRMRGLDGGHLLHRIAVGDVGRLRPRGEAGLDLLPRRGVEIGAEPGQPRENWRRRVGLHRVIDARQGQRVLQAAEILLDAVHVHDETRRRRRGIAQVLGDLWGHRHTLQAPVDRLLRRRPKVDETVERTSDQNGPPGCTGRGCQNA